MSTDATIVFKSWLPDQPDLENPGMTDARNVVPGDGGYSSYTTLTTSGIAGTLAALSATAIGAAVAVWGSTSDVLAAAGTTLYYGSPSANFNTANGSAYTATSFWQFSQFDDLGIATSLQNVPQARTIGSASAFTALATSGTAPGAECIGVINRFVLLGNLRDSGGTSRAASVAWSAIENARNWPTPLSATATAVQSGEQDLDAQYGPVKGIFGRDQYGVILQTSGLTRVTYVGPPVVFQFDRISEYIGATWTTANVMAGRWVYFLSISGFFRTDGVNVEPIGEGKVNRWFFSNLNSNVAVAQIWAAYDVRQERVMWLFPIGSTPDTLLFFDVNSAQWSYASESAEMIFTSPSQLASNTSDYFAMAFAPTSHRSAIFDGAPGSAILTTAETETKPGGFGHVKGVKPLVDVTANAVTVAVGTRNDLKSAVTYTAETTATARTGFCDFRSEARYHRARLTITGTFNAAQGIEVDAVWSGQT